MRLKVDDPHCRCMSKDGNFWCLPVEEADSFKAAWMIGKAFWEGTGLWEEPVVIKLGDIVGFAVKTVESIALREAEETEEAQRKMLKGEPD